VKQEEWMSGENRAGKRYWGSEHGASLVLVGVSLLALLSVMTLAVDLGMLYVARNEAQRAADSAALAGAYVFMTSGCTSAASGCVAGGPQEAVARKRAEVVGAQNRILGQQVDVQDGDVSFNYPSSTEPQITVAVQRTIQRSNAVPTIFARMFGVFGVNVTANATAEAFSPGNEANGCVLPFLVGNCDTNPSDPLGTNTQCSQPAKYFYDPSTGETDTSVLGKQIELHFGTSASGAAAPSQWYMIAFNGSQSGSQLQNNIVQCAPTPVACGDTLQTYNGKSVGPITHGVNQLINATPLNCHSLDCGQDTINILNTSSYGVDYTISGGSNNPNPALQGATFPGPSSSLVTAPIYDGHQLQPGSNGQPTNADQVSVIGFLQLFIQYAGTPGGGESPVYATVLNITKCDPGSRGTPANTEWSPVPIRLIRKP
jgi:Flp pilus assembly protein TadG